MDELAGGRGRGTGGYRLPGRTGIVEFEDDEADDDHGDDDPDPGSSRFGALLRHDPAPISRANLPVYAPLQGAGVLAWIERNRLWLVPWVSALIVVVIEVLAALFATRPIPLEGHAALGAFWAFAVSRGTARVQRIRAGEARLVEYARRRGIPLDEARDEWEAFEATVARTQIGRRSHGD